MRNLKSKLIIQKQMSNMEKPQLNPIVKTQKTRQKIVKISSCSRCPYNYYNYMPTGNLIDGKPWCSLSNRHIDANKIFVEIPEWCDLTDAEQEPR